MLAFRKRIMQETCVHPKSKNEKMRWRGRKKTQKTKDEGRGFLYTLCGPAAHAFLPLRSSAHSLCRPGGLYFSQAPAFSESKHIRQFHSQMNCPQSRFSNNARIVFEKTSPEINFPFTKNVCGMESRRCPSAVSSIPRALLSDR